MDALYKSGEIQLRGGKDVKTFEQTLRNIAEYQYPADQRHQSSLVLAILRRVHMDLISQCQKDSDQIDARFKMIDAAAFESGLGKAVTMSVCEFFFTDKGVLEFFLTKLVILFPLLALFCMTMNVVEKIVVHDLKDARVRNPAFAVVKS
jgi:hypothetical protein